jgi:hypothetical protein
MLIRNDNEGRNMVIDEENAGNDIPEDLTSSYQSGATAAAATVLDAEVVEERDLHQEVRERMKKMTIDATLVVNLSTKKKENNAPVDWRRKSTAIMRIVAAALIILVIASGAIIGTKTLRPKPLYVATGTASSPTPFFGLEYARSILTPLSGEEALMDESSPQYKALWWMVFEDPANMMMTMMVGNETQSSSTLMMIVQRYTMVLLYFSTDGRNWLLPYDFLSIQSICDWGEHIRCSEDGSVVQINMSKCALIQYSVLLVFFPFSRVHTRQNSPQYVFSFFAPSGFLCDQ